MLGSGDGSCIIKLRGLPFSTTVEDVLDFLRGVNVVNEKEGVHLTEVRPGRPSGECYVEVQSQADVDEALKKDKENMGKRYIEVFSTDRQDMDWALNAMNQSENGFGGIPNLNDDMGIVKLRGLPFGCSKEEIIQFFDGLTVAPDGVHLLYDYTGRASGEAFVHFVDKGSAQEALERDREKIGHRYIEVFPSSAEDVRTYGSRDSSRSTSRTPRPTPYDRSDRYTQRFSRGRGYGRASRRSGPSPEGSGYSRGGFRRGSHCVHMRGLPFKATPQDIAYFFKPVRPVNINILYDNSGRPSGEADVEFECHEDAVRAMRRDKHNMDHRYIELFLNSSSGGSGSGGGGGGGGSGSSGGSSFKPNRNFRNNY